jgi:hypothetical protein
MRIETSVIPRTPPSTEARQGPRLHIATRLTFARRFLLATLLILLIGGVFIGVWVGNQLESGILERTASIAGLYVSNLIEPHVESLVTGTWLQPADQAELDSLLNTGPLGEQVVALRIWSTDGRILYSPARDEIGQLPREGRSGGIGQRGSQCRHERPLGSRERRAPAHADPRPAALTSRRMSTVVMMSAMCHRLRRRVDPGSGRPRLTGVPSDSTCTARCHPMWPCTNGARAHRGGVPVCSPPAPCRVPVARRQPG